MNLNESKELTKLDVDILNSLYNHDGQPYKIAFSDVEAETVYVEKSVPALINYGYVKRVSLPENGPHIYWLRSKGKDVLKKQIGIVGWILTCEYEMETNNKIKKKGNL